jgi:adenylate cyclase
MTLSAQQRKQWLAIAAVTALSVVAAVGLGHIRFFQLLHLKARDMHFVLRGRLPTRDIVLITIDDKALNHYKELLVFWHPYYAEAIQAAAAGGAKALGLDVTFLVPVDKYEPDNDRKLAEAVILASQTMPVICGMVPGTLENQDKWPVPVNIVASSTGAYGMTNLTVDADDFVRSQELIEEPGGDPSKPLWRGLALRVAEKFRGEEVRFDGPRLMWGARQIPISQDRKILINFAGGPDTFPRVSIYDVIEAARAGKAGQLKQWFAGKAVLLGPDFKDDRHATPYYTTLLGADKWLTAGVEIHANTLRTLLDGAYLIPAAEWLRFALLAGSALLTASLAVLSAAGHAGQWIFLGTLLAAMISHVFFRFGILVSSSEMMLACLISLMASIAWRFFTAEKKGALFQSAVQLFVGREVAETLSETGSIGLSGKRQMVTILFSDIRGFTSFCDEKDAQVVVELLNDYLSGMVSVIVAHKGNVNKFIGDGILAIFSDDDEGIQPGDHALRALRCGIAMTQQPSQFKTGVGIHSGPGVVGNIGSKDKMEYTVLGDTVNLASRLESLNKEMKTQLLLSQVTKDLAGDEVETVLLGAVPIRGKAVPLNVYTAAVLHAKPAPKATSLAEKT